MVHDDAIIIWEKINKLFPMEEANLRLSLPKVIKGSFHMARSDAHPLFQAVEISLGITNTSSLKVSSTDWKTKISTNICGLVASQNGKGPTFHKFPKKDFRKTSQTLGRSNPKNHPEPNTFLEAHRADGLKDICMVWGPWVVTATALTTWEKDGESLSHVDEQSG